MEEIQTDFTERAAGASEAIDKLAVVIEGAQDTKSVSDDELAKATTLFNKATFYLAYGSDASNGFHSMGSTSTTAECIDKAIAFAQQGLTC